MDVETILQEDFLRFGCLLKCSTIPIINGPVVLKRPPYDFIKLASMANKAPAAYGKMVFNIPVISLLTKVDR